MSPQELKRREDQFDIEVRQSRIRLATFVSTFILLGYVTIDALLILTGSTKILLIMLVPYVVAALLPWINVRSRKPSAQLEKARDHYIQTGQMIKGTVTWRYFAIAMTITLLFYGTGFYVIARTTIEDRASAAEFARKYPELSEPN